MNYVIATFIARVLGILLVIPAMFPSMFLNWFPGLEDRRASWVLFTLGITLYAVASIVYYVLRKKEQRRRKE